jgi:hypothetical protein
MLDIAIQKGSLIIEVATESNDYDMWLTIFAPIEVSFKPLTKGISVKIEDTDVALAENMWYIEGLDTDMLWDYVVRNGLNEIDIIDWGKNCLDSLYVSQFEYLSEYVREEHVHEWVLEWLEKNIEVA